MWLRQERHIAAGQASGLAGHDPRGAPLSALDTRNFAISSSPWSGSTDEPVRDLLDPRGAGRREGEGRVVDRDDVEANVRGLRAKARGTRQGADETTAQTDRSLVRVGARSRNTRTTGARDALAGSRCLSGLSRAR